MDTEQCGCNCTDNGDKQVTLWNQINHKQYNEQWTKSCSTLRDISNKDAIILDIIERRQNECT